MDIVGEQRFGRVPRRQDDPSDDSRLYYGSDVVLLQGLEEGWDRATRLQSEDVQTAQRHCED